MSTLVRHAAYCADQGHDGDSYCESASITIGGIGEIHVTADETGPAMYVDDEARGLFAEFGRYGIDEAELVALAMLEAVRIARSDAKSANGGASADAGAF